MTREYYPDITPDSRYQEIIKKQIYNHLLEELAFRPWEFKRLGKHI